MPDPVSLLDQFSSNPFTGIESVLAPIVSGGAIQPNIAAGQGMSPQQQMAMTPAWLAFAQRMANAGAPTLGPAPTFAQALTGAMGAGYGAATQAGMLPFLAASAQREAMGQDIALQEAQMRLQRTKDIYNLQQGLTSALAAGVPVAGAPASAQPGTAQPGQPAGLGSGNETPATSEAINALPDVQKLPPAIRGAFVANAVNVGWGPNTAAQYARQVMQESGGNQLDPKTNQPLTSSAGAVGVAQVLPGTFGDMQKKYNISGDISDPVANLSAGVHYFDDQVKANGGNLGDAAIAYNAGPERLADYKAGKGLPDETKRYLIATDSAAPSTPGVPAPGQASTVMVNGKPMPVTVAAPTPAPGAPAAPGGADLVTDPLSGMQVPRYVLQSAAAAMRAQTDPDKAMPAYQAVIAQYAQDRAKATIVTPLRPDELATLPPQIQSAGPLAKRDAAGNWTGVELPAPRAVGMGFSQTDAIKSDLEKSPAYDFWVQSEPRFDAVISGLNQGTRAGDEAAIISLAKLFDPNVKASDQTVESAKAYGGIPQQLHELINRPMGESGLTNDVRQQIVNLANAEMVARDKSMFSAVARQRAYATGLQGHGIDVFPDVIGAGLQTNAMTADSPDATSAPDGITFAKPLTATLADPNDPNSKLTFTRAPGAVKRAPAGTPAAAPAVGTPGAPTAPPATGSTTTPPVTNKFTAAALAAMSNEGLNNAYAAVKAHPENFSQADVDLLAAEKNGRKAAGR